MHNLNGQVNARVDRRICLDNGRDASDYRGKIALKILYLRCFQANMP